MALAAESFVAGCRVVQGADSSDLVTLGSLANRTMRATMPVSIWLGSLMFLSRFGTTEPPAWSPVRNLWCGFSRPERVVDRADKGSAGDSSRGCDHLGYDKHDPSGRNGGNSRSGTRTKTVLTQVGPVDIEVSSRVH